MWLPAKHRFAPWRTPAALRRAGNPTGKKKPAMKAGFSKVARPEGFEPPTPKFVAWCSIQLSYGRVTEAELCRTRVCPVNAAGAEHDMFATGGD